MALDLVARLGLAIQRKDVALMLGPGFVMPAEPTEAGLLTKVPWVAIWSESQDLGLVEGLKARHSQAAARVFVEVPGRVNDVLGVYYSLAEVTPYFHLGGSPGTAIPLSPNQRRRARDSQIDELTRLRGGTLLVAGYETRETIIGLLAEVHESVTGLAEIIVVTREGAKEWELGTLEQAQPCPIELRSGELTGLLREVEERAATLPKVPSIRVGTAHVPLTSVLGTEPPIDQDYLIISSDDVRDPLAKENERALLIDLLSGQRPPWRAFAHDLAWSRSEAYSMEVTTALTRLRKDESRVECLTIPADYASGTTVLLQHAAFECAKAGVPTLIHRGTAPPNYDQLRRFLDDLFESPEVTGPSRNLPAAVFFDTDSIAMDSQDALGDFPSRLARDNCRVLVVQAIPPSERQAVESAKKRTRRRAASKERMSFRELPRLSAILKREEQESLLAWARDVHARTQLTMATNAPEVILNWESSEVGQPLLIYLYYVLSADLERAADLGGHLFAQIAESIPGTTKAKPNWSGEADRALTLAEIRSGVDQLRQAMLLPKHRREVSREDVGAVFLVLMAMGALRTPVPTAVLSGVTGLDADGVNRTLLSLERCDLATMDAGDGGADVTKGSGQRGGPSALYTRGPVARLRHPTYGRVLLEWMARNPEVVAKEELATGQVAQDILKVSRKAKLDLYPIELLKPIFGRLEARDAHVEFAGDLAARYLRLHGDRGEGPQLRLIKWQWDNQAHLVQAFKWLGEMVIRKSPSLLHSRGITGYKTCRRDLVIEDARQKYKSAIDDFNRALLLAKSVGGENPANIITSKGILYQWWADKEEDAGFPREREKLDELTEAALREARALREDSPHAAYGLAKFLVDRVKRYFGTDRRTPQQSAADLLEALFLLTNEPEGYFGDKWTDMRAEAVGLLEKDEANKVIAQLQAENDELGYVLVALRTLGGRIPTEPTDEAEEVEEQREAAAVLDGARAKAGLRRRSLGALLRYALFSADPERRKFPAYRERFALLKELEKAPEMEQPLWLFDYGMLCFQVGRYGDGADAFRRLRRNRRHLFVHRGRGQYISEAPHSAVPRRFTMRVTTIGVEGDRGWGQIEHPERFHDPIPFSFREFQRAGTVPRVGHVCRCVVWIGPAGPLAEPEAKR